MFQKRNEKLAPVAILAGGLATRMRLVSATLPKSLLPVAGEPFIAHQLRRLEHAGISDVVLCTGHLGAMIEDFVGNGAAFGLRVRYSREQEQLLGTGGALRQALPLLGERFFVLYGDSYLDLDYRTVRNTFADSRLPALMTVYRNEGRWGTSNVVFRDRKILRYDKRALSPDMAYIDYGLGLFDAAVLAGPAGEAFDLADLYRDLAAAGQLAGYCASRRFYEIGTPAGLAEADVYLRGRLHERE